MGIATQKEKEKKEGYRLRSSTGRTQHSKPKRLCVWATDYEDQEMDRETDKTEGIEAKPNTLDDAYTRESRAHAWGRNGSGTGDGNVSRVTLRGSKAREREKEKEKGSYRRKTKKTPVRRTGYFHSLMTPVLENEVGDVRILRVGRVARIVSVDRVYGALRVGRVERVGRVVRCFTVVRVARVSMVIRVLYWRIL